MAASRTLAIAALLVACALSARAAEVTLCFGSITNTTACGALFTSAARAAGLSQDTFTCVSGESQDCTRAVAGGQAHLTKYGGTATYAAWTDFNLQPVVVEELRPAAGAPPGTIPTASYASVAVVRQEACTAETTLADFAGKAMCATGYRRTAGWTLPVGFMAAQGILPIVAREAAVEQDAESVASFFSRVCAVGISSSGGPARNADGENVAWTPLCSACTNTTCVASEDERFSDYDGALRCLTQGSGDIAFTKHDMVLTADPSIWESQTVKRDNLRLVCGNKPGCQPVENWKDCHIALSPSHAFVATSSWITSAVGQRVIDFLAGLNETFINATRALDADEPNVIFTGSANKLKKITDPANGIEEHFGAQGVDAFEGIRNLQIPTARICTISAAEKATCDKVAPIMNQVGAGMRFSCVQEDGDTACLQAIQNGQADMRAFDGPDTYNGYEQHGLMAVVAERNPDSESVIGVDYYAVAVVRKSFCDSRGGQAKLTDLRGKRACATGYRRNAGWSLPTGTLVKEGVMPVVRNDDTVEDDAESWNAFFSGGICAARTSDNGPVNTADGRGARWEPLCSRCKGDCNPSTTTEPYYDYTGALRCLMEDGGDVAFTKHTIALDFSADGRAPDPAWSTLLSTDMQLLCPGQGGCVPLSQAYRCHIGLASAHAVMVRADYADAELLKTALRNISLDATFRGMVFSGTNNPSNHLFKYTTSELVPINTDRRGYLGQNYDVFQGLDILASGGSLPGAGPVQAVQDDGKTKLSGGAIAGIVIGAAVGGALLAALVVVGVIRYRKSRYDIFKETQRNSPDAAGINGVKGINV